MNRTENNNGVEKNNINWYPGHMAKTKRLIKENLNYIDIVYELIDSRMPYSSKIRDIDDLIKNKNKLLIMTKYDLCDKKETDKWVKYYKSKGYEVLTLNINDNINNIVLKKTKELMNEINKKRIEKGMKARKARILVLGIPNVGKSTLINKLSKKKVANVGNKPGVTKNLNWLRVSEDLELLDTPGILWPKIEENNVAYNLAALSAIKEEILPLDKVVIYILKMLNDYYPNILYDRFKIKQLDDDIALSLEKIGENRAVFTKNRDIDYERLYNIIINEVKNNTIKNITFDRYED